jgi:hypothetical protein
MIYASFLFEICNFQIWKWNSWLNLCVSHKLSFFSIFWLSFILFSVKIDGNLDLLVIYGGLRLKRKESWSVLKSQCIIQFDRQQKFIARLLIGLSYNFIPALHLVSSSWNAVYLFLGTEVYEKHFETWNVNDGSLWDLGEHSS